MRAKTGLIVLVLLMATIWAAAQQQAHNKPRANEPVNEEQARATQADMQRMRTLVQQMQMNLVSLPPGPTPLRHQFELEIEMWQALITHMERQLQTLAPKPGSPPKP